MRSRFFLFTILFVAGSLALPLAAHAAIPFFGPIIPDDINRCAAGWGAVIDVINRIISFSITIAIVFVAPLMIAYAGFLYVVNPVNASGISEAKKILTNTVVGIVIALSGWLIVDAIMAVLYNANAPVGATGGVLGTWSSIVYGDSSKLCLIQEGALNRLNQTVPGTGITGIGADGSVFTGGGGTLSTALSTSPGDPCNPATIMAAVPNASISQANLLACIAKGESTCGTKNPPYNLNYSWNKDTGNGKASTAAGAYQVLLSSNSSCYDNAVCEAAGGTSGVPLNCKSGFDSKGFPISGSAVVERCKQAAGNVGCSSAAAVCLLQKQSFSSAYATNPYTASCQSKYGT